jgi:hypothetical protein
MTRLQSLPIRVGTLAVAVLWSGLVKGQNLSVTVDPVNVRQQGTISFTEFPAGEISNLPQDADPVSAETDDHQYRIIVDLKSIKPARFGTFNVDLYIQKALAPSVELSKFVLTGTPIGGFLDSNDFISVHVVRNGANSKATLSIPPTQPRPGRPYLYRCSHPAAGRFSGTDDEQRFQVRE